MSKNSKPADNESRITLSDLDGRQAVLSGRWRNIRHWLTSAMQSLDERITPDERTASEFLALIDGCRNYLEHNELELALDELEALPKAASRFIASTNPARTCSSGSSLNVTFDSWNAETIVPREYWLRLGLAARCMELTDRADQFLKRYQHGTNSAETLSAIRLSTLTELEQPTLGVTQQFFQVHLLHDEPKIDTCIVSKSGRQVGHGFVSVQDEPYYWVVQSEQQPDGSWKANWGLKCVNDQNDTIDGDTALHPIFRPFRPLFRSSPKSNTI